MQRRFPALPLTIELYILARAFLQKFLSEDEKLTYKAVGWNREEERRHLEAARQGVKTPNPQPVEVEFRAASIEEATRLMTQEPRLIGVDYRVYGPML